MRRLPSLAALIVLVLCWASPIAAFDHSGASAWSKLPAEAVSSISSTLGRQIPGYNIESSHGGLRARNPRQAMTSTFAKDGVSVETRSGRWKLRMIEFGSPGLTKRVADVAPLETGNKVSYNRDAITEWYVNRPAGLEQGFTVNKPVGAGDARELVIAMVSSGDVVAKASPNGDDVNLVNRNGGVALRYSGLTARDATGNVLRAWLDLQGQSLLLHVNVANARYPVVIDPWVQAAKLTASDSRSDGRFGLSVAVSGDTVVVGGDTNEAYVFVKPASGWTDMTETAKLVPSDGAVTFGFSVAVSNDTIVVGAPYATVGSNSYQGQVYIFVKPAGGWTSTSETAKLISPIDKAGAGFGWAVAVSRKTIVVGASGARRVGSFAFVFVKPVGGWVPT